jgi:hypothetical protein
VRACACACCTRMSTRVCRNLCVCVCAGGFVFSTLPPCVFVQMEREAEHFQCTVVSAVIQRVDNVSKSVRQTGRQEEGEGHVRTRQGVPQNGSIARQCLGDSGLPNC